MILTYGQPVRVSVNAGVAGLVKADFTIKLTEDGAASTLTTTVTELTNAGTGIYEVKFSPPSSSVKKKYHLHVTYGTAVDSGWEIEYLAPIAGGTIRLYVQASQAGLTLTPYAVKDGNTDAGMSWTITENATLFGTGIYQAVATLPASDKAYWLHCRFYNATDPVDTGFDIYVEPTKNHAQTLVDALRVRLGGSSTGIDTSELSDSQLLGNILASLYEFSKFKPRIAYDSSLTCVTSQADYDLPDDTISIVYCMIRSTLTDITNNWQYFRDYSRTNGNYTGTGEIYYAHENNQLVLRKAPTSTENGYYIGLMIYRNHVFVNSACTTVTPNDMDRLVLLGAEALSRIMWAGYQGTVRQGSASEDRENQRTAGNAQWKEYRNLLGLEAQL
jgi:hypothetical protein